MCCIGTLNHCRELWIAHTGLDARCTNRSRSNTNFYDVCTTHDEFLGHVSRDNISSDDGDVWKVCSNSFDELDEEFRISIGYINTNPREVVLWNDFLALFPIGLSSPTADGEMVCVDTFLFFPVLLVIVFGQTGEQLVFSKRLVHGEGSHSIHVGCHNWNPCPRLFTVAKGVGPRQLNFTSTA